MKGKRFTIAKKRTGVPPAIFNFAELEKRAAKFVPQTSKEAAEELGLLHVKISIEDSQDKQRIRTGRYDASKINPMFRYAQIDTNAILKSMKSVMSSLLRIKMDAARKKSMRHMENANLIRGKRMKRQEELRQERERIEAGNTVKNVQKRRRRKLE